MATRGFILYLISGFSVAILATFFITDPNSNLSSTHNPKDGLSLSKGLATSDRVWPKLAFNWRVILATVIGFFGSAFGTVGGVGGGGIFVPMLNLVVGFDTKSAAALSKCMIMGASTSSVWYNLRVPHPTKEVPIIDYDLALLFQPMLMLGITFGVALSVVFPFWLITILIIILFVGTSLRSFVKGIEMWEQETILNQEYEKQQEAQSNSIHIDADYDLLVPQEEKSGLEILKSNLRWKGIFVLMIVWISFLLLQAIKNLTTNCSLWYWVLNFMQIPVALVVYGFEAVKLYKESKERRMNGNMESVCEATIQWSALQLGFCAFAGLLGGTVGGLLGSGGGFILGPLLLELGVIPQVALFLIAVSVAAGFWGQIFVRKLVLVLKRASVIVFILSAVIFASALTMGVVGIEKSLHMIHNHEYMGFLTFCS
ncbi:hypothetical protein MKW98_026332 [Papaver atlanticum]|uniref:Sulfite exporter TauE/SafE family protein n=1 Tax=Papaver atlanticum TaxID=357466 RepID=A0AAD4SQP9_9MAGN|nr:hypothetical protein MKW98_026332 [Papaver atlanticum]